MAVVTRGNVEKTKAFIRERLGNPYVYGGALSSDVDRGTDCSEVWQTTLEMVLGRWVQGRQSEGATTESYRYIPIGGVGPFGTIRVARPQDIPADAVAKLAFHHGPGGGANSHMWGELDGMLIESGGSKGLVTAPSALRIDSNYATAWAYLPGPIVGDGTTAPSSDGAAEVLARATGLGVERAREILPTLTEGLKLSDCTNVKRIAMWLAQVGHESDGFNATEEYAKNGRYAPYIGRTWIQITWEANYRDFGKWAKTRGLLDDPNFFVNNPVALADLKWAGIGPAWYWTVQRTDINTLSDRGDLDTVTYRINGGYNGIADRRARYSRALACGDDLLALLAGGDDDMFTDEDRDMLRQLVATPRPSKSPFRHLGEGAVNTYAGFGQSTDGLTHPQFVAMAARAGHSSSLALLAEVASAANDPGRYPDRQDDARLARAILAEIEATNPSVLQQFLKGQS